MTNKAIAKQLKLASNLIELTGGNEFKARAFSSGARTIEQLSEPVEKLVQEGSLTEVQGIGKSIAKDITELVETGDMSLITDLLSAIPTGLLDVLQVKGLGPKKVRTLWQQLDVTSLETLETAAASGQIASLQGFGAKTAENIVSSIEQLRAYAGQLHYAEANGFINELIKALEAADGIERAEATGEFRRQLEVIGDVVVVVEGEASAILDALAENKVTLEQPDNGGPLRGETHYGLPITIHKASHESYGRTVWATTGSESHIAAFVEQHGMPTDASEESTIYETKGLAFIHPAMRENMGELEAAADGSLPQLIEDKDLKGTLHNHTTYSDGAHSLREMIEETRSMDLSYFGVCDHSQSLQVAHGLPIEKLLRQIEEVASLNSEFAENDADPFRVFSGTECDILADGSMDYPDEILEQLDVVVASIHTNFGLSEAKQTDRLIAAVSNPHVDILGHPTGRLLLRREGYKIDHEAVLQACAETNTAVEINANPWRLDLDWRWVRRATALGIPIAINPDAHAKSQLHFMRWGVSVAQKGWLTASQCLNALSADDLADWLHNRSNKNN
ncbi:MAG: helix-hairpin-helix domain-containing protein [Rubricoccaceae bacterium]|nr:helix-hairpin-helix domain-containing protein [Rubricoccaceae bacterium]